MKDINNANAINDKELENVVGGISGNDAVSAAMQHAGVAPGQAMVSKCEPDFERGRQIYEIEFYFNGMEYEYEIDANTGAVLDGDIDRFINAYLKMEAGKAERANL